MTGDDCYVMTAHVRDVTHLEELIDQFAAYGQTTTSILQSSPVPRRALTPPGLRPAAATASGSGSARPCGPRYSG